jgi:hypothetical protein
MFGPPGPGGHGPVPTARGRNRPPSTTTGECRPQPHSRRESPAHDRHRGRSLASGARYARAPHCCGVTRLPSVSCGIVTSTAGATWWGTRVRTIARSVNTPRPPRRATEPFTDTESTDAPRCSREPRRHRHHRAPHEPHPDVARQPHKTTSANPGTPRPGTARGDVVGPRVEEPDHCRRSAGGGVSRMSRRRTPRGTPPGDTCHPTTDSRRMSAS